MVLEKMKMCKKKHQRIKISIRNALIIPKSYKLSFLSVYLNKLDSLSSKDALCQVWLILA